eukprot:NODE_351_length_2401_cov_137.179422_g326_i0.p1 GENE.NODE_351_length_2401_cov_137.179422_g326_i0~~NODE_351_length_2401_cov_137.179422_g326_i0.p1  ORF type:complete len:769 (+),score=113.75 NODE_351_length_2401_cov_137.179422_g326_i0:49-2355(+)
MKAILLVLLAVGTSAQLLTQIGSQPQRIRAADLFKAPASITASSWNGPLDSATRLPQSQRTIYIPFQTVTTNPTPLVLTFASTVTTPANYRLKLDAPFLEQDPWNCDSDVASRGGNCRCNLGADEQKIPYTPAVLQPTNTQPSASQLQFNLPNWVYFPHAPYPSQNPFERTYRKMCLSSDAGNTYVDTTVWLAVVKTCATDEDCGIVPTGASWFNPTTNARETLPLARPLPDGSWPCADNTLLGAFWDLGNAAGFQLTSRTPSMGSSETNFCWGESLAQQWDRHNRTDCQPVNTLFQHCTNRNYYAWCGARPYDTRYEKCCGSPDFTITHIDQTCKCSSTQACPSGETCCLHTKYSDILPENTNLWDYGLCYNASNMQCCNDGNTFDPVSHQCCPINGVQSLNLPCPCNMASDCPLSGQTCCLQRFPRSWKDGEALHAATQISPVHQCHRFANWPDGTASAEVQRCNGQCFDSSFQTCCNGVLCSREVDRCCNSTCCNRFTSTCLEGSRSGSVGFGSRINANNYGSSFETCSEIEAFTTRRAFWVFAMPCFMLAATLLSFAVVIVVARRATENVFEVTEQAVVVVSSVIVLLALPLFFAPTYKYGIIAVFVALFAILAAVLRSTRLSLVAVILLILLVGYWVDPFEGNIYLSLTGGRSPNSGASDGWASGIAEYILNLERTPSECTSFYDFFQNDLDAHDFVRRFNPARTTYGYCSRAWLGAILIFALLCLVAILTLLLLTIFSLTKKLVPKTPKGDITFHVRPEYEY